MKNIKTWIGIITIVSFVLLLTYDIIITKILSTYYCLQEPNPKTYIKKKVEYPESIYWEDNVYPGFSKTDRETMIMNYLDGIHLKKMALNGDDGKHVYVYHLNKPIWDEFQETHNIKGYKLYEAYAKEVMKSEKIYTKQTMPKMNYTVTFNEVKLNSFTRKFLYSDETKVIDNKTDEVIAYNQRIMKLFYNITPRLMKWYYDQKSVCGYFSDNSEGLIFQTNGPYGGVSNHRVDLNEKLYKKYIEGEK